MPVIMKFCLSQHTSTLQIGSLLLSTQVVLKPNKLHCILDLCSYPPGVRLGPVALGRRVGIVSKGSQTGLGRARRRCR